MSLRRELLRNTLRSYYVHYWYLSTHEYCSRSTSNQLSLYTQRRYIQSISQPFQHVRSRVVDSSSVCAARLWAEVAVRLFVYSARSAVIPTKYTFRYHGRTQSEEIVLSIRVHISRSQLCTRLRRAIRLTVVAAKNRFNLYCTTSFTARFQLYVYIMLYIRNNNNNTVDTPKKITITG